MRGTRQKEAQGKRRSLPVAAPRTHIPHAARVLEPIHSELPLCTPFRPDAPAKQHRPSPDHHHRLAPTPFTVCLDRQAVIIKPCGGQQPAPAGARQWRDATSLPQAAEEARLRT